MIYYILKFLIVVSSVTSGYLLSKRNANGEYFVKFPLAILNILITFTFIQGLRYGRGSDYPSYADLFVGIKDQFYEPIFSLFSSFLVLINAHFSVGFILSSFFLIFSGCFLIKRFRFAAVFSIPLFYLSMMEQSENLVRMYFAFSFIFIALAYLMDNVRVKSYIFLMLAFLTHFSVLPLIVFILIFEKIKKPISNISIILILYALSNIYIVSAEFIYSKITILRYLDLYSNYVDGADKWLLGDGLENSYSFEFGLSYYIRYYLNPFILFLLGYKILEKYKNYKLYIFFNLFVVGILFRPTSLSIPSEFFYRIDLFFTSFSFVVASFIFYDFAKYYSNKNIFYRLTIFYLIIDYSYLLTKTIFTYDPELGNKFLWEVL